MIITDIYYLLLQIARWTPSLYIYITNANNIILYNNINENNVSRSLFNSETIPYNLVGLRPSNTRYILNVSSLFLVLFWWLAVQKFCHNFCFFVLQHQNVVSCFVFGYSLSSGQLLANREPLADLVLHLLSRSGRICILKTNLCHRLLLLLLQLLRLLHPNVICS